MYILFRRTKKKKNVLQKKKGLTFEDANLSIGLFFILSYKGPNIYVVHTDMEWGDLKVCHMFTDFIVFKQQINCLLLRIGVGSWGGGL